MELSEHIAGMSERKQHTLRRAHEYLMPNRVETWLGAGIPLVIGRREGYRIWDVDGHELLDLHLNGGTYNLGHRHPALLETLRAGLEELDVGNHHFPSEARAALAEQLAQRTPGDLHYSVFTASGTEANDVAIRSARHATGRRKIVTLDAGFHGTAGLAGAAGRDDTARYFHSDYPTEFATVPFDDLGAIEKALAGGDVAAVLLETIPATYGFPIPSPDYLPGVKALCEQHGTLYVADEVQTGLGRTGQLWAVEAYGIEPDILITGKGLSGGLYPVSAVVMTREVGAWLVEKGWGYVSTFGGAELGCLVGARALELCSQPDALANATAMSALLGRGLDALRSRHPFLVGVRRQGLVMGLETDHPMGAVRLSRALYARGVWAMFAGFDLSVLQWKPGLLVDEAYCTDLLERLDAALGDVENEG
ncbi:MAG: aminotransferase class III-fold pyridoxal phosphate-dependent enzyme [Myxococcota bacterium]|nr:aminotransferase class III-fold pyridoxal phosphate-dependent enzyme [Myxococcota bacterium]